MSSSEHLSLLNCADLGYGVVNKEIGGLPIRFLLLHVRLELL